MSRWNAWRIWRGQDDPNLVVVEETKKQFGVVKKLLRSKDIRGVVCATDAGREGELIFRYIAQYAKTAKPTRRLWLQSMTPASIREGFAHLRSDEAMRPLADAAREAGLEL